MSQHSPDRRGDPSPAWQQVDEGWGRRAVDFATLSEPANCREYVALHHHLRVGPGDRLLDLACGAGLAVELATAVGATCCGIDASPRLIAVARDRNPDADLRVGDMHDLPWDDASFDVVTSFRGIWGTTPDAVAEAHRVLAPGGRLGITVWGHIKISPGAWALAPLALASEPKVEHQAAMVALGRPGRGRGVARAVRVRRRRAPRDPVRLGVRRSRGLRPRHVVAGPGVRGHPERRRGGVRPVGDRASPGNESAMACRCAPRSPLSATSPASRRRPGGGAAAVVDGDVVPRRRAALAGGAAALRRRRERDGLRDERLQALGSRSGGDECARPTCSVTPSNPGALTYRQRAILVTSCAAALGDSYCALAWGNRLAGEAGAEVAERVIRGDDEPLDSSERALASWARRLTRDPSSTTAADVESLRDAGFDDAADLRHLRVRRAAHRVLHGQRRARRPTRLATGCRRARRSPRRRHVRPTGRATRTTMTMSRRPRN